MADVQDILMTMQAVARHEVGKSLAPQMAVVTSVHGANGQPDYAATVTLRETGQVLPKVPIATGLIGAVGLPEENDLVVLLFLNGDAHAPVVAGRLYSDDVAPPPHGPGDVIIALPPRETDPAAQMIVKAAAPDDGSRALTVDLGGDVAVNVTVTDGEVAISVGETVLTLSQGGASDGRVELVAGDAKVVMEQAGDMSVEAAGKLTMKAREIELSGDVSIKLAGQTIDLN